MSQITVEFAVTIVGGSGSTLVLRLTYEPLRIRYRVLNLGVAAQTGSQTPGVLSRLCCYGERSGRDKEHEKRCDIFFEVFAPTSRAMMGRAREEAQEPADAVSESSRTTWRGSAVARSETIITVHPRRDATLQLRPPSSRPCQEKVKVPTPTEISRSLNSYT